MKLWSVVALGLGAVDGKRAEKKGWLSVSHRNMFQSDLPIVTPEGPDTENIREKYSNQDVPITNKRHLIKWRFKLF